MLLWPIKNKAPKFLTAQYCHPNLRSLGFRKRCYQNRLILYKFSPRSIFFVCVKRQNRGITSYKLLCLVVSGIMSGLSCSNFSSFKFLLTGFQDLNGFVAESLSQFSQCAWQQSWAMPFSFRVSMWTYPCISLTIYYFPTMLTGYDLGLCVFTIPTVLELLWLNFESIHLYVYVFQFYFVHTFSFMDPTMLLVLAYNHFVTISNSLGYPSFLTSSHVLKVRVFGELLSVSLIFPDMCLLVFSYCHNNILSHSYYLH